jgi:DNA polymerase I
VASLYPSLMRSYRIGPSRDRIGAMLTLVDGLVEHRLEAKARAKTLPAGSAERHRNEAVSAALKIVVNSAYGYLGATQLTRFADVHAANEVTRRGREVLSLMCWELAARGVTLLEADTDGVYFSVPVGWTEEDERRVVAEVAALMPPLIQLEFEGRYAAMLSHEPKNYALLGYDGKLVVRGVAFRSSRSEPFGDAFLRRAIAHTLIGDIVTVQQLYISTIAALRKRAIPTYDVSSRVRLTKSPEQYKRTSTNRRELSYEAMIAAGLSHWKVGERVRVYRKAKGEAGLVEATASPEDDRRDYDVEYYVKLLRESFASRLSRAFAPDDFNSVFSDPDQFSLFARPASAIRTVLTPHEPVPAAPA